jgi:selenocysteine lyase/cysteine desulfurase
LPLIQRVRIRTRSENPFLAADGHKWLLGPEGAGVFYIRRELIESTRPLTIGWMNVINAMDYGHYDYTLKPDAGRYECGTYNVPGLLALKAAVQLLSGVGIDAVSRRVFELTSHFAEQVARKGYRVVSPRGEDEWSGGIAFTSEVHDQQAIFIKLRKEHRIEIALREGRLRCSPHFYNTREQMDRLTDLLPGH